MKSKLTANEIYKSFFTPAIAAPLVSALPVPSTQDMFQTHFRIGRDFVNKDPTAIAMLLQNERMFRNYTDMTLFVSTWNIDQKMPPENLPDLIEAPLKQYDLYVFNCQEIDMTAECIVRGRSPIRKEQWDNALLQAVSKNESYKMLASRQLGTCYISAFVKEKMAGRVKEVNTATISYGKMGFYNKTSVGIRMEIDDAQFCFICSHLSHGGKNVERRNSEFWKIQEELVFNTSYGDVHVLDHDAIIWSGDFNYRLTLSDPESRRRFKERDFLLKHDQLLDAHAKKKVFVGYKEAPITFTPTYKYDRNSMEIDTSHKQRGPAWCDRVMYRTQGTEALLKLREYDARHCLMMSDHHPVYAIFNIKPWTTNQETAKRLYSEIEGKIRTLLWSVKLSTDVIDFETVRFGEQKTRTFILKNTGQVPVLFSFRKQPCWLKIEPNRGSVATNQNIEITVSILIDQTTQRVAPVICRQLFANIELVFPEDRPPMNIPVIGSYLVSPIGMPLSYLVRMQKPLSEIPPDLIQRNVPTDVNSAPITALPSAYDVPSEMFILVDELLRIGNDPTIFFKTGESDEVKSIFEDLRVRRKLNGRYNQHSVAEALLNFMECLYEPLVSEEALTEWNKHADQLALLFVHLRAENVKALHYISSFINYLFDTLWKDDREKKEYQLFEIIGPVLTGRTAKTYDQQKLTVPLAAALIKAWRQREIV